jgi:hypothetical protein
MKRPRDARARAPASSYYLPRQQIPHRRVIPSPLSLLEQGFRNLTSPIAFVRAGGFFENFFYGLQVAQGGTLPVYYNPTNRKSTMVVKNDIGAEVVTF